MFACHKYNALPSLTRFILTKDFFYSTMKKPFTIVVEGNIGSGKTTFINYFKNNENVLTMIEPIEEWKNVNGHNLLHLMYEDINSWAFTFQTYVQLTMTKAHKMPTLKPVKILERSLYSARFCFVENLYNEGIIAHAQLAVLDKWFDWLVNREQVSCDLIVYLRSNPDVAYERIRLRNRKEEHLINRTFIQKLHEYHESWLYFKNKFYCPSKVLVLDANKDLDTIREEYEVFQNEVNYSLRCSSQNFVI